MGTLVPYVKGIREGGWLCLKFDLAFDAGDNEAHEQIIC